MVNSDLIRKVKWISHDDYPMLENTETGRRYADISLGKLTWSDLTEQEYNRHGIAGDWHLTTSEKNPWGLNEPISRIRPDIIFELQTEQ